MTAPLGPFKCPDCGVWWAGFEHRCQKLPNFPYSPAVPEPYDSGCCACIGTCMHTGPHSYCGRHGGKRVYRYSPNTTDWTDNTSP